MPVRVGSIPSATGLVSRLFGASTTQTEKYIVVGEEYSYSKDVYAYTNTDNPSLVRTITENENLSGSHYYGAHLKAFGDFLVVTAYQSSSVKSYGGTAFLYRLSTGEKIANLEPATSFSSGFFGKALTMNSTYIFIGHYQAEYNSIADSGAVEVFDYSGNHVKTIVYSDQGASDWFGSSLDCNESILVVGANGVDTNTSNGGAISIYNMSLNVINVYENAVGEGFGNSVACNKDIIAVGCYSYEESGSGLYSTGRVQFFDTQGNYLYYNEYPTVAYEGSRYLGRSVVAGDTGFVISTTRNEANIVITDTKGDMLGVVTSDNPDYKEGSASLLGNRLLVGDVNYDSSRGKVDIVSLGLADAYTFRGNAPKEFLRKNEPILNAEVSGDYVPDFENEISTEITIVGDTYIKAPINIKSGQRGVIILKQDGTGNHSIMMNQIYKFENGIEPSFPTTAREEMKISYYVGSKYNIYCSVVNSLAPYSYLTVSGTSTTLDQGTSTTINITPLVVSNGSPVVGSITTSANASAVNNGMSITYTPNEGFSGSDSFDFTVTDNTQTKGASVSVTVVYVPTTIDINDYYTSMDMNGTNTLSDATILANSTDPDGGTLSIDSVGTASNGSVVDNGDGTYTYTPTTDYVGDGGYPFDTISTSGNVGSASVVIDVVDADAPQTQDVTASTDEDTNLVITHVDLLNGDTDPTGGTLSVSGVSDPVNGTVTNSSSDATFVPDPDYNGTATFRYTALSSNGKSAKGLVTVTVNAVNDPVIAEDFNYGFVTDSAPFTVADTVFFEHTTDPDGDTLSIAAVTNAVGGSVVDNGDNTFTFTATASDTDCSYDYTVSDGTTEDTATMSFYVGSGSGVVTDLLYKTFCYAPDEPYCNGVSLYLENTADKSCRLAGGDSAHMFSTYLGDGSDSHYNPIVSITISDATVSGTSVKARVEFDISMNTFTEGDLYMSWSRWDSCTVTFNGHTPTNGNSIYNGETGHVVMDGMFTVGSEEYENEVIQIKGEFATDDQTDKRVRLDNVSVYIGS